MTLVSLSTGILVAAITIPLLLLLYFLRLRRQSVQVSSTLLWRSAVEDLHANSPFQRLRPSALLLLQLLAVLLVSLALMQPQIKGGAPVEGRHILLIDRSGSMSTKSSDGTERLEEAKEKAIEFVDQLYGGGLFSSSGGATMVIAFADNAVVVSPFTDSKQLLVSSIRGIKPTHGGTNIGEAFSLARAYLTNVDPESAGAPTSESASIDLFSDGAISDIDDQTLMSGETMTYHMIGLPTESNIGIATMDAKRTSGSENEVQVFLSLVNTGNEKAIVDIELLVDSVPLGVQEASIPGQSEGNAGTSSVVFIVESFG